MFNIAVEDASPSTPAPLQVQLLGMDGGQLIAPFNLPLGATNAVSAGTLQPGDYELHIVNPPPSTRYKITSPANVKLVAVDSFELGSVWLASYREYFSVPMNTSSVRFHSSNGSATFAIYDQTGAEVAGQPVSLGNNLFEVQNTTSGTWGINVKGASLLRFLNVPQVAGFEPGTQATPTPSGGAPCTSVDQCPTANPDCTDGAACPSGMECPAVSNGWRFGLVGRRICERPDCCSTPAEGGTITSSCGMCLCEPNCSAKTCGDTNLDDGCHGRCTGVCSPGQSGCQRDSDCTASYACRAGACVPGDICSKPDLAPPNCGPGALCGPCLGSAVTSCEGRQCGSDPVTGANCGSCGASQLCNGAGRCASDEETPPIVVSTPDGSRPVIPDDAPVAPTLVGATQGSFSVTDRGSASYSIPIDAPPGRAGIEPHLALRYTSSTANGALGIGWSLDGFSSISRCARTFAQDGYARAIVGDSTDAFCLDGQRLVEVGPGEYRTQIESFAKIVVDGSTSTGPLSFKVYGKDGRVRHYGESGNSRSTLRGTVVGSWELSSEHDRSGNFLQISYEQTTTDRTSTRELGTSESVPKSVTYTASTSQGGDREVRFNYDSNRNDTIVGFKPGGGAFARSRILRSVETYVRWQLVRRYALTYEESVNKAQRLVSIQECVGAAAVFCHKPTEFTYYDEQGFAEGHVKTIPNEEGMSLPPPLFPSGIVRKNEDGYDVLTVLTSNSTPYYTTPIPPGASTAVSVVPVAGPIAATAINLINMFGLKKHESLHYESYTFDMLKSTHLSGAFACGSGEVEPRRQVVGNGNFGAEAIRDTCPSSSFMKPRQWLVDMDADGVQDLVYCAQDALGHLDYKLARAPTVTSPQPPIASLHAERDGEVGVHGHICHPLFDEQYSSVIDVDGDGSGNLVAYDTNEGWAALLPSTTGYTWSKAIMAGIQLEGNYRNYVYSLDANGDGLRDLLFLPNNEGRAISLPISYVALNTGRGFEVVQAQGVKDGVNPDSPNPALGAYTVDLDQDGIDELVFPDAPRDDLPPLHVPERGTERPWRVGRFRDYKFLNDPIPSLSEGPGVLGDFDGDGDIDAFTQSVTWTIQAKTSAPYYEFISTPKLFQFHSGVGRRQNLLKSIIDGDNHSIEVSYDESNALGPVYKKFLPSGHCDWPQRCVARTDHPLVSSHVELHFDEQARAAAQTDRVLSYQYEGARVDTAGYGWLGFSRRTISTEDGAGDFLGSTTIEYEDPEPWTVGPAAPYVYLRAGLPSKIREQAPVAHSPIVSVVNPHTEVSRIFEYTTRTSASGRPFIFRSRAQVDTYEVLGSVAPGLVQEIGTTDLDGYGNPTHEETTRTDYQFRLGISSLDPQSTSVDSTVRDFTPTPAEIDDWLISLPKSIIVSSTPRCALASGCSNEQHRVTSITYDPGTDLPHVITRESSDVSLWLQTEAVRDGHGNVTQVTATDGNGDTRTTTTSYDSRDLFPVTTSVVGYGVARTTQVRYDDRFGLLTSRADPNGIDETWSYDDFGVSRIHTGPGGRETLDYEISDYHETSDGFPLPSVLKVTASKAGGSRTESELNSFGQVVSRKSFGFNGANVFEEFGYDSRQRLTVQRRPHLNNHATQGSVYYGYDELDRLVSEDYPNGAHVQHDHASVFSVTSSLTGWYVPGALEVVRHTDPRGNKTITAQNRDGQTVRVVDAATDTTSYTYGAFGALEEIVALPAEFGIYFNYDEYNRLWAVTDGARGGSEFTAYNAFDQPVATYDAAGRLRQVVYDGFGRVESIEDDDGSTDWIYDGSGDNEIGRPVEVTSSSGQRQVFKYEPRQSEQNRGLLAKITSELYLPTTGGGAARSLTTSYRYDASSRLEQIDYPASSGPVVGVKYGFDAYGHTIKASDANNASKVYWQLISAHEGFRVAEERLGTHSCGSSQGTTTTRTYEDLTGRQKSIQTRCGSQILQDLAYAYDLAGNLASRGNAVSNVAEAFKHDELNRLTEYSIGSTPFFPLYTYDPAGRGRLDWQSGVGSYAYEPSSGRDWVASAGSMSYGHDAVGNITSRVGPGAPGGSQQIDYTTFDLPKRITSPVGQFDFAYDANGARVVKQSPSGATFYAGDGYQRTDTTSAVDQRYTIFAGGRAVAQISNTDSNGALSGAAIDYLHDDNVGSVNVISNASGAVVTTRNYTPFGKSSTSPSVTPYGFTGQEMDDDLGLINMRGRLYDPVLGQFLSADPLMQQPYGQGLNRFAYVNNSPLNYTDPSGFAAKRTSKAWGGDGEAYGIMAGIGGFAFAGATSALWAGPQAIVSSTAAAAPAGAAAASSGIGTTTSSSSAAEVAQAAYGPASGAASAASGLGSIISDHATFGHPQPTTSSAAGPVRSGGGVTGGAAGRGVVSRDATAPVQERAAQSAGAPSWSAGTVDSNEPLADPSVQRALGQAWTESNPSSNCFQSQASCPPTKEQGGWILKSPNGKYEIQRWSDAGATHKGIDVPRQVIAPRNYRLAGSFHTHPNLGPDWEPSASPADWRIFGNRASPHYIVSGQGTYRLTNIQQCLGAGCPTTNIWPYLGGGALAVGVGVGIYAYVESRD